MLRRQPTAISLIQDDIDIYDLNLKKRLAQEAIDARPEENQDPNQFQGQDANSRGNSTEAGSGAGEKTNTTRSRQDRIMSR